MGISQEHIGQLTQASALTIFWEGATVDSFCYEGCAATRASPFQLSVTGAIGTSVRSIAEMSVAAVGLRLL
jgi:hypothetical protein